MLSKANPSITITNIVVIAIKVICEACDINISERI